MGIWNSTLVYVGARTLLAGAMIALLLRRQVGPWYAGGQVVSDLSCAAFLLAYVNADVREDVGWLVVPLLLFVLYWEATRFLENRRAAASSEEEDTWLDTAFNTYGWIWTGGFVVPAVLAGCFVMFDLVAPHQWPFPNPRPDIACTPRRLRSGGELTVRMRVPHGSQLTVFRPNGEAVQLIPYGVRSFEQLARFTLATDTLPRVFADSGLYALTVSKEAEVSASLMCRIRYEGQ